MGWRCNIESIRVIVSVKVVRGASGRCTQGLTSSSGKRMKAKKRRGRYLEYSGVEK